MSPEAVTGLLETGVSGIFILMMAGTIIWLGRTFKTFIDDRMKEFTTERETWQATLGRQSDHLAIVSDTLKEVCNDLREHRMTTQTQIAKVTEQLGHTNGILQDTQEAIRETVRLLERLNGKS